ncbi:hypothetical protein BJY01DRAFT_248638 [Aspergillus pseudoustus]|uniref:Fungal-specific transcription factor domain-containing protein n=1 Tax=Aspergillus pseudoustus TaxID=1810923 RepID=A0ABR4JTI4_9EURO
MSSRALTACLEPSDKAVPTQNNTMHAHRNFSNVNPDSALNMEWWPDSSWAGQICSLESPSSWTFVRDDIWDDLTINPLAPSELAFAAGFPIRQEQVDTDHTTTSARNADQEVFALQMSSTPRSIAPGVSVTLAKESAHHAKLFALFQEILQPPAAILIGGQRRWRRLQRYLVELSTGNRIVRHALLCVIELLGVEQISSWNDHSRQQCEVRILDNHRLACEEVDAIVRSETVDRMTGILDELLAVIVLLAWFEVIQDQDEHTLRFPQQSADIIITTPDYEWNRYSRQLLSWLSILDSKGTCLSGRSPLLSTKALEVVSKYPTQIITSNDEEAHSEHNDLGDLTPRSLSSGPIVAGTSLSASRGSTTKKAPVAVGHGKQIVLQAIIQPALEWYSSLQLYTRRISALDKHHRRRFTPEDEYEVVIVSKDLENKLWELWDQRPTIISLSVDDLTRFMSADVATRAMEVFSVHLASFWILFVYLHRVCWWSLPHSETVRQALEQVWRHFHSAYGEQVQGREKHKTVHPALLWPVFLFGSECQEEDRRAWAVGQLQALGQSKPVLRVGEDEDSEVIPPFRMSSGVTRNASRAAVLLKELIERQTKSGVRVDDRDLAMEMFGCYFCFV